MLCVAAVFNYFNSIKVQLEQVITNIKFIHFSNFNFIKVQLELAAY